MRFFNSHPEACDMAGKVKVAAEQDGKTYRIGSACIGDSQYLAVLDCEKEGVFVVFNAEGEKDTLQGLPQSFFKAG